MLRFITVLLTLLIVAPSLMAQRKVTPVENEDKKPRQPVLHYYDKHGKPLDEPVLFVLETDTVQTPGAKAVYPLLTKLDIGLNIFDGVMMLFGQKHGGFDINLSLPLWNWLCPAAEIGLGFAHNSPDDGNFTYDSKPAVYAKIGADYNFLYKSNPDYRVFIGLRCGFSSFSYSVRDITITSGYWGETLHPEITGQRSTAFYGEALAGLQVKIYRNFSMGWTMRYKFKFHFSDGSASRPWYIPGYGARDNGFGATFSLIYNLPIRSRTPNQLAEP